MRHPTLVENTEVVGTIALKLYAATTDIDVHWIISLLEIDSNGKERLVTKGSHRELEGKRPEYISIWGQVSRLTFRQFLGCLTVMLLPMQRKSPY